MHRPRKRFGQHFLRDAWVLERLIAAIAPKRSDVIIEIGPGRGALTGLLLDSVGHLHAVEIDRDLACQLKEKYPPEKLTIHCADALDFDFASIGNDLRIVGNLPYNISTELLFRFADVSGSLADATVMLQKEVIDRITAGPSQKSYGRLSVMLQRHFRASRLFEVSASAFFPPPQVKSAVVVLTPRRDAPPANEAALSRIVTAAFCQRRKILANALAAYLSAAELRSLGIDDTARPENLTGDQFVRIANFVSQRTPNLP